MEALSRVPRRRWLSASYVSPSVGVVVIELWCFVVVRKGFFTFRERLPSDMMQFGITSRIFTVLGRPSYCFRHKLFLGRLILWECAQQREQSAFTGTVHL